MVVSEVMRAQTRRDKAPAMEVPAPPKAEDASESSREDPRSIGQYPAGREAYVMVDALKNFMSTMTNTLMQQVLEYVKKAVEAASSAKPLLCFEYVPTVAYEPSHRHAPVVSRRHSDGDQRGPSR